MRRFIILLALLFSMLPAQAQDNVKVQEAEDHLQIDTDVLQAKIRKKGYVSGIASGSLLDKKTGARDLGFGLHIMDFLLGPGWKDDEYTRDARVHGNLPKHYIEGPQICTQAKKLDPEIIRGKDFVGIRMRFTFTKGHNGFKPGSLWEQTLVFQPGKRWVLCGEKITSANDVPNLIYRIDMPGHVKHKGGDTFSQVYLSYQGTIPAKEFLENFAPDARFLYQRQQGKIPERMIRAYQVSPLTLPSPPKGEGKHVSPLTLPSPPKGEGKKVGPWLAGMTLAPDLASEAWCHQRGYICFIQELFGRPVKTGETIAAAYIVGYFDSLDEMHEVYDRYKGIRQVAVSPQKIETTK